MAIVLESLQTDNIPDELKARRQWVCWRYGTRKGKRTKLPKRADSRDTNAAPDNRDTWNTFGAAVTRWKAGGMDGIGYVISANDPYVGIDLDKCRDKITGAIEPAAQKIIDRLATYAEVSPSSTGIKLIGRGQLPTEKTGRKNSRIEMYHRVRYFTFTGWHLDGTPTTINDSSDEITALFREIFDRIAAKLREE